MSVNWISISAEKIRDFPLLVAIESVVERRKSSCVTVEFSVNERLANRFDTECQRIFVVALFSLQIDAAEKRLI